MVMCLIDIVDNYFQLKITNEKLIKIYVTNIYVKERTKLYKKNKYIRKFLRLTWYLNIIEIIVYLQI